MKISHSALLIALGVSFAAVSAQAQENTKSDDTVVVTGARGAKRTVLNSVVPIDVVRAKDLSAQGSTELGQSLSRVAPSLNFPRPSAVDGTDSIRPASLRGLSPDQTLVLVDGKRRHSSALVNLNGSAGRGSSAVDLNAIPTSAIDKIEVLRDGASAQYGSDAIAGVINLHLLEASKGGGVSVTYGEYDTTIKAANSTRDAHDGATKIVSGWVGLPLGDDGFVTISGEYRDRAATSRGDIDPTVTPVAVTTRYGDPEQTSTAIFVNAGKPINNDWSLYSNLNYQKLDSESAAFFRHSNSSGNVLSIYPNGFMPIINAKSEDLGFTFGAKGKAGAWDADYSVTYGTNKLDYYTLNSVNPTYGTASKTSFYDGELINSQLVFNGDISRQYDVAHLAGPLTLAFGVEARSEQYQIKAGELQSYGSGPLTSSSVSPGAQGFGGFQPSNEVSVDRSSIGLYTDVSANITDKLSVDTAVRYALNDLFALRGSISNGFRAPSLAQQYFTSTASVVSSGQVILTGTYPSNSDVARALGGTDLKPEKSNNQSLGVVFHKGRFELSVDGYNIRIGNRIVLSENIAKTFSPQVAALLAPYGVNAARFFINGVTSTTTGVDLVASYRIPTENYGNFNLTVAANNSNTVINRYPSTNVLSSLSPAPALFARIRQYILTNSSPETKASFSVNWQDGPFEVNTRATYYGNVIDAASVAANDIHSGDKTIVDLSGTYSLKNGVKFTLGADNLLDTYPKPTPAALNTLTGNGIGALAFTRFSPFGFNGRYVYARVSYGW